MKKAELILPSPGYLESYLEACREFKTCGRSIMSILDPDEYETWKDTIFQRFEDYRQGKNLPEGYVPGTTFWLVEDGEYIGSGNLRHRLTENLERFGGHIGYAIRPSMWGLGYGTLQLSFLLREAAKLGISEALLTCDNDNIASYRVMEKNGGRLIDTIAVFAEGKNRLVRRYFIPTGMK